VRVGHGGGLLRKQMEVIHSCSPCTHRTQRDSQFASTDSPASRRLLGPGSELESGRFCTR
jgi:hypothetical protein